MNVPEFKKVFDTLDDEGQKNVISKLTDEELKAVTSFSAEPRASLTGPGSIGIGDVVFGDKTLGEFAQNRVDAVKNIPLDFVDAGKQLKEMSQKRPEPLTPERISSLNKQNMDMAFNLMPITRMSAAVRQAITKPALQGQNVAATAALQAADKAGYQIPVGMTKQGPIGRALTNIGERFAGKEGIKQTGQALAQPLTNTKAVKALANTPQGKALGITEQTPMTAELLDDVTKEAHKAYEAVRGIGTVQAPQSYLNGLDDIAKTYTSAGKSFPAAAKNDIRTLVDSLKVKKFDSSSAVDMVKILREDAKKAFRNGDGNLGHASRKAADLIEKTIGEHLLKIKAPKNLVQNYQSARRTLAITKSIDDAFNPSTGNVAAQALGQMQKRGVPLSDELKEVADFARGFKDIAKEPIGHPPAGGMLEPLAYAAFGKIVEPTGTGLLAAGVPLIGKPIARKLMFTRPSTKPPSEFLSRYGTQRTILGTGMTIRGDDY